MARGYELVEVSSLGVQVHDGCHLLDWLLFQARYERAFRLDIRLSLDVASDVFEERILADHLPQSRRCNVQAAPLFNNEVLLVELG